jgi:hypothetical protein
MNTLKKPKPLGLEPSFGFGDRLGVATPGHLDALRAYGGDILPIFAQQSIREMQRTRRDPDDVMRDASDALREATYTGVWSADADHLKTEADVNLTAGAGFVFFTIDPSDYVDQRADDYSISQLKIKFATIRHEATWCEEYLGKTVDIPKGPTIEFTEEVVQRAAVKYARAIAHATKVAEHIDSVMQKRGRDYEIELSVDETAQPTSAAEHYLIAQQCLRAEMKVVSLAPRFVGDFEKGIDYRGDLNELEDSLRDHAAIARHLGPYKLSLHSGSDKLSMYTMFAQVTGGMFHVKTAGTSYLEALRALGRHDERLLRRIIDFSRERFDTDKATYHISAQLERVPPPKEVVGPDRLEQIYLNEDDGRQILHVTFGSVMTDSVLGPNLIDVLRGEPETYRDVLMTHFAKHLKALTAGM